MDSKITRKRFIKISAAVGASLTSWGLSGCAMSGIRTDAAGDYLDIPLSSDYGKVVLGQYAERDMKTACKEVLVNITDMKWLKKGDSVFIKLACNSGNIHPAVTSPAALEALVEILREHGAGKIYAGDQSGIENVRLTQTERKNSTTSLMKKNGLFDAVEKSGAILHNFDDQGWNNYFRPEEDFTSLWGDALRIPEIVKRVDHIIYLNRLGSHAIAGYTAGIKNGVGWLRDDSRFYLHKNGDIMMKLIAEINRMKPLRDKIRLVLTPGDSALLNIGPDFGSRCSFDGIMVLASTNLFDHDAAASQIIRYLDTNDTSFFDMMNVFPSQSEYWNRKIVRDTWDKTNSAGYKDLKVSDFSKGIEYDIMLSHFAKITSYRPERIIIDTCGNNISENLIDFLSKSNGEIFSFKTGV